MKQFLLLALISLLCLNIIYSLLTDSSNGSKGILHTNHAYYTKDYGSAKNCLQTPLVTTPEVTPHGLKTNNRAVIIAGINKENYEDGYLLIATSLHPFSTSIIARQNVTTTKIPCSNRFTNKLRYLYANQ